MGIYMNMNFFNSIKEFFVFAFKYVQTNIQKIIDVVTNMFTGNQEPVPTDPVPPDERPTVPEPIIPDPPKQLDLIAVWNVY